VQLCIVHLRYGAQNRIPKTIVAVPTRWTIPASPQKCDITAQWEEPVGCNDGMRGTIMYG